MSITAPTAHISRDSHDVAWISGTQVKVVEIVADWLAHGSSPEEMHFQFPHLSLAQIHSALAFYYDHQIELEADIARRLKLVESLRTETVGQPGRGVLLARPARR